MKALLSSDSLFFFFGHIWEILKLLKSHLLFSGILKTLFPGITQFSQSRFCLLFSFTITWPSLVISYIFLLLALRASSSSRKAKQNRQTAGRDSRNKRRKCWWPLFTKKITPFSLSGGSEAVRIPDHFLFLLFFVCFFLCFSLATLHLLKSKSGPNRDEKQWCTLNIYI